MGQLEGQKLGDANDDDTYEVVLEAVSSDAIEHVKGCDLKARPDVTICETKFFAKHLRPVLADILRDIAPKVRSIPVTVFVYSSNCTCLWFNFKTPFISLAIYAI